MSDNPRDTIPVCVKYVDRVLDLRREGMDISNYTSRKYQCICQLCPHFRIGYDDGHDDEAGRDAAELIDAVSGESHGYCSLDKAKPRRYWPAKHVTGPYDAF